MHCGIVNFQKLCVYYIVPLLDLLITNLIDPLNGDNQMDAR